MISPKTFHLVGILCIGLTVLGGFWLFGIGEKAFFQSSYQESRPTQTATSQNVQPATDAIHTREQNLTKLPSSDISKSEPTEPLGKRLPNTKTEQKLRTVDLERRTFKLYLEGQALLIPSTISKEIVLSITMVPKHDAALTEFEPKETKMIFEKTSVGFSLSRIKIEGKELTMYVKSDAAGEYALSAHLDEELFLDSNYQQKVRVVDQMFYLTKKEMPYKLSLVGSLTSSP